MKDGRALSRRILRAGLLRLVLIGAPLLASVLARAPLLALVFQRVRRGIFLWADVSWSEVMLGDCCPGVSMVDER